MDEIYHRNWSLIGSGKSNVINPHAPDWDEGGIGKPQGTCARVSIGQVLLSVRCKDSNSNHTQEALRHAKFKFPGCQKIIISGKCLAVLNMRNERVRTESFQMASMTRRLVWCLIGFSFPRSGRIYPVWWVYFVMKSSIQSHIMV
ncbi:hypothetical protein C4D60_Mb06t09540 [Musa balbisiana]|uniref:Uncharacterized protein n=1 Tax=Musa balbisiana TaxID=52838 RepID=A0A4S8ILV5_MUSBA|nr:hypothetical protein C4D60_Mb06t09540 [Musa balbisiana]